MQNTPDPDTLPKMLKTMLGRRRFAARTRGVLQESLTLELLTQHWDELVRIGQGTPICSLCNKSMKPLLKGPEAPSADRIDASDERNPYVYLDGRRNFQITHLACNLNKGIPDCMERLDAIIRDLRKELQEMDELRVPGEVLQEEVVVLMEMQRKQVADRFLSDLSVDLNMAGKKCTACLITKPFADFRRARQLRDGELVLPWNLKSSCLDCIRRPQSQRTQLEAVRKKLERVRTTCDPQIALEQFLAQNGKCGTCGQNMELQPVDEDRRSMLERALEPKTDVLENGVDYDGKTGQWIHGSCNTAGVWYPVHTRSLQIRQLLQEKRQKMADLATNKEAAAFLLNKRRVACLQQMRNMREQMLECSESVGVKERTACWERWIGECPNNTLFDPCKMVPRRRREIRDKIEESTKKRKFKSEARELEEITVLYLRT
jgi:hypothetical protein